MNKIIIVGHPQSGCQEVESLLHACGMKPPLPSKRDGLLPVDIGITLCKAYKKQALVDIAAEEDIRQIDVGSVWNGMALDLLLANLDQELWGWSDPQAIYLLDYWKALDPKVTFVLVYDEPHRVLAETAHDKGETLSLEELSHRLDNWSAYNGALLSFFLRNPGRCLLVNVQQVRRAASSYLKALQARLDAPLASLEFDQQGKSDATWGTTGGEGGGACPAGDTSAQPTNNDLLVQASSGMTVGALAHSTTPLSSPCSADGYLINCVMAEHPDCLQRYEELQSVANLPLGSHGRGYPRPTDAWLALVKQRAANSRVFDKLLASGELVAQELQQQSDAFQKLLEDYGKKNNELTTAKDKSEEQAVRLQKQIDTLKGQLARQTVDASGKEKELTQENELLLLQLHQVQEGLENIFLKKQDLEQQADKTKKLLEGHTKTNNELTTVKKKSEEQAVQLQKQIDTLKEQLAKQTVDAAEMDKTKKLLESHVKTNNQLTTAKQKSEEQAVQLQKQIDTLKEQLVKQTAKAAEKPTAQYKELSQENELLLLQLHQVQEELERYYLENQQLKKNQAPAKALKPVYYGADERIKRQLSYRLGAVIVQRSNSLPGLVGMPWALAREARSFRQENALRPPQELPPIEQYQDAYKAEKVKRHLSYRLGTVLVQHGGSPVGWLKMPFLFRRQIKAFQQQRKGV